MGNVWVISDTHFNHKNILKFEDKEGNKVRPFSSLDEMNELMIENWNRVVKTNDKVYHLGDVFFGSPDDAKKILKRLNGKKRLIVGNHDHPKLQVIQNNFQKIMLWRHFGNILLTHVPVHPSILKENRFGEHKVLNVHGHTHKKGSPEGPYKSACVELINYTPKNLDEYNVGQ